jgi:hypothetical protein
VGTLALTDPVNGTTVDATLHANNNSAIKTVVNGNIENVNVKAAAAIAVSKLAAGLDNRAFLGTTAGVPTWRNGPLLTKNTTAVGTGAATGEVDLQTLVIGAGALAVGDLCRITTTGTTAGANAAKRIRTYFGGTLICDSANTNAATGWRQVVELIVTGASAQKGAGHSAFSTSTVATYSTPAIAISGAITVKTTGETAFSADEVTSEFILIEIIPAWGS